MARHRLILAAHLRDLPRSTASNGSKVHSPFVVWNSLLVELRLPSLGCTVSRVDPPCSYWNEGLSGWGFPRRRSTSVSTEGCLRRPVDRDTNLTTAVREHSERLLVRAADCRTQLVLTCPTRPTNSTNSCCRIAGAQGSLGRPRNSSIILSTATAFTTRLEQRLIVLCC